MNREELINWVNVLEESIERQDKCPAASIRIICEQLRNIIYKEGKE